MKRLPNENRINLQACDGRHPMYEAPTIIYDEVISTRAGSPAGFQKDDRGVDPTDLFSE